MACDYIMCDCAFDTPRSYWTSIKQLHYCSRRELCCFTRERHSGLVFNFRHVLLLLLQCFPIFSVSRKIPKTAIFVAIFFVVFVAAAGGCLVEEKEWYDLLGKEDIVFRSVYTLNPFMSWLILQNDSQFPGLGKADSVLCKIGRRKPTYHCCVCRN